jgi:hypothetical protein
MDVVFFDNPPLGDGDVIREGYRGHILHLAERITNEPAAVFRHVAVHPQIEVVDVQRVRAGL